MAFAIISIRLEECKCRNITSLPHGAFMIKNYKIPARTRVNFKIESSTFITLYFAETLPFKHLFTRPSSCLHLTSGMPSRFVKCRTKQTEHAVVSPGKADRANSM
ncbi:hypothetical protein N7494_000656 [Penicillium frequentans]|uniref:Uncharacterized protein n=1 Tax=Penicillium frequentans TaxID=3151616 RepID=A0AAD6GK09_9EURO|nr:hypothetical protein N7494_000656 [Penicillium glabrum]